ncbi:MAG: VWA domain-containing protein [Gemmatimonadetes bacterium]|nr:VWA domain-containing protein [Gemmatimonadota bacterium]
MLDTSGSMLQGDKMAQARRGALGYADSAVRRGYAVGLISFASVARHLVAPTVERDGVRVALEAIRADGSTDMAAGLRLAARQLGGADGTIRVICVVTDGQADDERLAIDVAKGIRKDGIQIQAVGTADADWSLLKRLTGDGSMARHVEQNRLSTSIAHMAQLLPPSGATGR